MLKVRVVLLALVAVFVASVAASAVAQAQEGPVWHVNGKKLETNETRAITDKNVSGTTAKLKGTIAGAEVIIICKKVSSSGYLAGGNPGTNKEVISFTECSLENIKGCVVTVASTNARSVLGHVPNSTKMLVDFGLEKGATAFTTIKIRPESGKTCTVSLPEEGRPVTVATGDTFGAAAEIEKGEEVEETKGILHFPTTAITEDEQEGKIFKVGLEFDGAPSIFSAQIEVELVSGLKYGAFQK